MGLPAIAPYPLPVEADLPANRACWPPVPDRAVLLVHDMQEYFLGAFPSGRPPVVEVIDNIRQLRKGCDRLGIPVVYTAQPANQRPEDRGLLVDFWGPGMGEGPRQSRIVDEVAPTDGDTVLTKWRYSAFSRTGLEDLLGEYGRDQLLVCGVYAHIGCLVTACDAFMRDVRPFLVADAVADFSLEYHRMALDYAARRCAVTLSTRCLLNKLEAAARIGHAVTKGGRVTDEGMRARVAELLAERPEEVGDDDNLIDIGLDSIRIMSLVEELRREGIDVTFAELAERPTLAAWWRLLSGRTREGDRG